MGRGRLWDALIILRERVWEQSLSVSRALVLCIVLSIGG